MGVFGEPQPGHLYCVQGVGFLQPKRSHRRGYKFSVSAKYFVPGGCISVTDPRQQVVYELASALAAHRIVPNGLYKRAQDLLGDAGIVDVTVLMGWFTMVSLTLMAFDVPSNAVGLEQ